MQTSQLQRNRIIATALRYVFALSYRALTFRRDVIASISYRSEHIGAVIASHSYRSKLYIDALLLLLVITFSSVGSAFQLLRFL